MNEADTEYVIFHEKAHLKRKDHIWKPLGFLLLSVYWFNPVLWLAYVLLCKDIELACDEKVIRQFGAEIKKPYSEALINCSVPRKMISACPLAFGEIGVKERVKGVLSYKKPAFWIILVAVIACIITAVCLLTNPAGVRLSDFRELSLEQTFEKTAHVFVGNGETYTSVEGGDVKLISDIQDIRISRRAVSQDRSESRDQSNTLLLQSKADAESSQNSVLPGTYFCFNSDYSELWISTGVKPTLSYRVLEPQKVKAIFERLRGETQAPSDSSANSSTQSQEAGSSNTEKPSPVSNKLKAEGITQITTDSLPPSSEYNRTITDQEVIRKFCNYVNQMSLKSEFPENPNHYSGMSLLITVFYEDGSTVSMNSFGNMFFRFGTEGWLRINYSDAVALEQILLPGINQEPVQNKNEDEIQQSSSHSKPDSIKVNDGLIIRIEGNHIVVEEGETGIYTNDPKFRDCKVFAFLIDHPEEFRVGDRVRIAHYGDFKEETPPLGIPRDVIKIDA